MKGIGIEIKYEIFKFCEFFDKRSSIERIKKFELDLNILKYIVRWFVELQLCYYIIRYIFINIKSTYINSNTLVDIGI